MMTSKRMKVVLPPCGGTGGEAARAWWRHDPCWCQRRGPTLAAAAPWVRTLSCAPNKEARMRAYARRESRFQIAAAGAAARGWLTLPGEVNRRLPTRNPSGVGSLYRRRGWMIVGWAEIVSFSFPGHFCSMGSGFWIVIKSGYCRSLYGFVPSSWPTSAVVNLGRASLATQY
jgi:hypothetical protein